jgi:hypothetical protein
MDTTVIIVLLVALAFIIIVLAYTLIKVVGVIEVQNDNNMYLITRLYLKLGDYADINMDGIRNTQGIIREDVRHDLKKPFDPHKELNEIDPLDEFDE